MTSCLYFLTPKHETFDIFYDGKIKVGEKIKYNFCLNWS